MEIKHLLQRPLTFLFKKVLLTFENIIFIDLIDEIVQIEGILLLLFFLKGDSNLVSIISKNTVSRRGATFSFVINFFIDKQFQCNILFSIKKLTKPFVEKNHFRR